MLNPSQTWTLLTADSDFQAAAVNELQKTLGRSTAVESTAVESIGEGLFLAQNVDFFELSSMWTENPPIFVRHICPVMAVETLGQAGRELSSLQRLVDEELSNLVEPSLSFSVQTRILGDNSLKPFDVNRALSRIVQQRTNAELDVRGPDQILSVVIAPWTSDASLAEGSVPQTAFLGLSLAAQNLSNWAGGKRRFRREPDQVSRAEFKLLEALEVFEIELPPRGVALDLGASPGGWTRVLRQQDQYVTAIDPGELDARLAGDAGIRHLRTTAEAYLENEPDRFDLIVNDMRMDARDSARLMVAYARQLYRHGIAIMTLKLPEKARGNQLEKALEILDGAYDVSGARQLFHNRSEVTVYLQKSGVGLS